MSNRDIELECYLRNALYEAGYVSSDFLNLDELTSEKNILLAHVNKNQEIQNNYRAPAKERLEAATGLIFGPIYILIGLLFIVVTINNFENIQLWYETLIAGFILMLIGILAVLLAINISSNSSFSTHLTIVKHNSL